MSMIGARVYSIVLLSLTCFNLTINGQTDKLNSSNYFTPNRILRYIQSRTNMNNGNIENSPEKGAAIWAYDGVLSDPFTGKIIARCEGLELVRAVGDSEGGDVPKDGFWQKLSTGKILNLNSARSWEYAASVLSRKLFCYIQPSDDRADLDNENVENYEQNHLLHSIRLTNQGKVRKLAAAESVAVYDNVVTFLSRSSGKAMAVITEWPDGRFIIGSANAPLTSSDDSMEYTVYAKRRTKLKQDDEDDDMYFSLPSMESINGDESCIQPPRSKIVQFGKDTRSTSLEQTRYGARESYSYKFSTSNLPSLSSNGNPFKRIFQKMSSMAANVKEVNKTNANGDTNIDSVRYTRYGECPPWYGPSKMCSLELVGKRVQSLRDAPPVAAKVASQIPGFTSVNAPLVTSFDRSETSHDDNLNEVKSAIDWFKNDTLDISHIEDEMMATKGYSRYVSPQTKARLRKVLKTLKAASRFTSL